MWWWWCLITALQTMASLWRSAGWGPHQETSSLADCTKTMVYKIFAQCFKVWPRQHFSPDQEHERSTINKNNGQTEGLWSDPAWFMPRKQGQANKEEGEWFWSLLGRCSSLLEVLWHGYFAKGQRVTGKKPQIFSSPNGLVSCPITRDAAYFQLCFTSETGNREGPDLTQKFAIAEPIAKIPPALANLIFS